MNRYPKLSGLGFLFKKEMKKAVIIIVIVLLYGKLTAQTTSILFIGNSYTYVNNLPQTLHDLALSKGDSINFDSSAPGGYTLNLHSTNATTVAKINQQPWDYVVLQEQSQMPAFPPSQVATDTYPYARILDSMIVANDSCTETLFYMTWGRQNGDSSNCAFYPPICTYNGMQQSLRESYLQMASDNHASCSPVGVAWKHIRDNYPSIGLYQTDQSHPTIFGTYLAACVFYASVFHKSPIGASFPTGITSGDAFILQSIGGATVLDSLALWQGGGDIPNASFTNSVNGNIVQFNNQSANSTNYSWNFGDGNNSTQINPSETYPSLGQFVISLTASNNCKSFLAFDTIQVNYLTGISSLAQNNSILIYPNPVNERINIELKDKIGTGIDLRLFNSVGQLVMTRHFLNSNKAQIDVSQLGDGLYNLILTDGDKILANEKLIVE